MIYDKRTHEFPLHGTRDLAMNHSCLPVHDTNINIIFLGG